MKYTFSKDLCKTVFTQNNDGSYNIEHWSYLTCRNNWWYTGTRYNCPMGEAEEMMARLDRKGYVMC